MKNKSRKDAKGRKAQRLFSITNVKAVQHLNLPADIRRLANVPTPVANGCSFSLSLLSSLNLNLILIFLALPLLQILLSALRTAGKRMLRVRRQTVFAAVCFAGHPQGPERRRLSNAGIGERRLPAFAVKFASPFREGTIMAPGASLRKTFCTS